MRRFKCSANMVRWREGVMNQTRTDVSHLMILLEEMDTVRV